MAEKYDKIVVQKNVLLEAKNHYNYSLEEFRLIFELISQVDKDDNDLVEKIIELTKDERKNLSGVKKTVKKLLMKPLELPENTFVSWFSYMRIENGQIRYRFVKELVPFLIQIKNNHFTKYQLKNIVNLKSKYSVRMYEQLKMYHGIETWKYRDRKTNIPANKGGHTYKIEDFRRIFCIPKSYQQTNITKLMKEIHKELNEKTDLGFNYKFNKNGFRSFQTIEITTFEKKWN